VHGHFVPTPPNISLDPVTCPIKRFICRSRYSFNESFLHDERFDGFSLSLYEPYEPQFTRDKFARTAANARAAGVRRVRPTVSLGTSYIRNASRWPDLDAGSHDRDHPFFSVSFDMTGTGGKASGDYAYDPAFSALLGAQINQPRFNSSGEYSAFGPWEQSIGAAFYPGVFSLQSAPSPINKGSSIVLDHFVAYVQGATANISVGPFELAMKSDDDAPRQVNWFVAQGDPLFGNDSVFLEPGDSASAAGRKMVATGVYR